MMDVQAFRELLVLTRKAVAAVCRDFHGYIS
jgi:hypothetical protein